MTPEGGALLGLCVGTALLTGNLGNLAVGIAAGAACTALHYQYHAGEIKEGIDLVERKLGTEISDHERKVLDGLKKELQNRLSLLKVGSGLVGAATVICPIGGAAYVIADYILTEKQRARYRAHLDEVCA